MRREFMAPAMFASLPDELQTKRALTLIYERDSRAVGNHPVVFLRFPACYQAKKEDCEGISILLGTHVRSFDIVLIEHHG